jgi:hypothetical protein
MTFSQMLAYMKTAAATSRVASNRLLIFGDDAGFGLTGSFIDGGSGARKNLAANDRLRFRPVECALARRLRLNCDDGFAGLA